MTDEHCTMAIQSLLTEGNASMGLDLEFDPSNQYPKTAHDNDSLGYKLQRKNDPDHRRMSLAVDRAAFGRCPDGRPTVNSIAKDQILAAIARFWSAGNCEKHTFISVG